MIDVYVLFILIRWGREKRDIVISCIMIIITAFCLQRYAVAYGGSATAVMSIMHIGGYKNV